MKVYAQDLEYLLNVIDSIDHDIQLLRKKYGNDPDVRYVISGLQGIKELLIRAIEQSGLHYPIPIIEGEKE